MGTNYYYHEKPPCPCCKREFERKHIGKSSGGWCFSLKVYTQSYEEGPKTLPEWWILWNSGGSIVDEYGVPVTPDEMLKIVTERTWHGKSAISPEYLRQNHAELGPNGLMRHLVDGRHCSAHGEGTWDLMCGEFS